MIPTAWPLLGQATDAKIRTTFEWGRIQDNSDWIVPITVCVAILLFVRYLYVRDAAELHPALGWLLTALRTATFFGLLVLYLQPQWRSEREVVRNSRAVVLVDTSLSMGLSDADSPGTAAKTRLQEVTTALADTDLISRLRKTHDVAALRFNDGLDRDRIAMGKLAPVPSAAEGETDESQAAADAPIDWTGFLKPGGSETQLGAALRQVLSDESGMPLSGIILVSDGGQNAGIAPEAAVELARKANVPVFTVGIGSDRQPTNVRLSDLAAPARAYPGDRYEVTGYLQAQGMAGQVVGVQLLSREPSGAGKDAEPGTSQVEAAQQVTLGADGEVLPVKFTLTPDKTGRRTLCLRVQAPAGDREPSDDFREADIEIVDHKNHVLLLAGGPMREYHFLRALLHRDRSTRLDVLLQTAQPGISQEADKLLDEFPTTREAMFDYDCVVAFDPDWQATSAAQVNLLEQWVAEQGGGLVVIAGPVYAGKTIGGWVEDKNMAKIRALYPVEFPRRFSSVEEGVHATEEPWPLDFTREGLQADFLALDDTAAAGQQAWAGFAGVHSCCPVRGPKPGATVLARFSDPRSGQGGQQPVYFATQFYGSGRVFYMGSGEMWRLRKLEESYFERFYTKVLRHVSQGRLLRGSSRGVLLVGQERYLLGNTVEVHAQLTNARLEPLTAPSVELQVVAPDRAVQTVALSPDAGRAGTYVGRFPVLQEGAYRLELPVPESDGERLTRRIQVQVPNVEREHPQRNDALLGWIARQTKGEYYVGLGGLLSPPKPKKSVVQQLEDRSKTEFTPEAPDPDWERRWLGWMMTAICGLLSVEWLIRRLAKLA